MSIPLSQAIRQKQRLLRVAQNLEKADLVLKDATFLNVFAQAWEQGDIAIAEGRIAGIGSYQGAAEVSVKGKWLVPSFIDGHIHLESSLVSPAEFARAVVAHGTGAVVADPHEIANVMGLDGIQYMLQASQGLPLDVWFMIPSCVPATPQDESGAVLTAQDIAPYLTDPKVLGLAEMMNFPGLLAGDEDVLAKIAAAEACGKRVDGHAPGLSGAALCAYAGSGVLSDHECSTAQEALEKLRLGQWIMIREGTAAQNLEALLPLLKEPFARRCLFVTDDKHPEDLLERGHLDFIVREAVRRGVDPILALTCASFNAANAFGLAGRGALAPGYAADIALLGDLEDFSVQKVWKDGVQVFDGQGVPVAHPQVDPALTEKVLHSFHMAAFDAQSFARTEPAGLLQMVPGQIITLDGGMARGTDVSKDVLKIAVLERHRGTGHIGVGYLKGYGLRRGAIATSIAHDSHNLIVVGCADEDMACAASRVAAMGGGIAIAENGRILDELSLPLAGLMSLEPLESVNRSMERLKACAASLGVDKGVDPLMTLSFMSLPVIPSLRVLTQGVFSVDKWEYISR